ncbi:UDP-galactopyranose mutase [Haploplasma axanthum]|uniref:UDP-galactopyranose mutase n=1 Tax=Haploplasma axanthum TaxID=29552 RepID=A0A449BBM7_HAPAX|nr:UDP-galactopyranose mutase [Haploplasma axanthum]VEU79845.1 UDP-galactopyranose mutase [Haploplasma axanthum]
MYDYLIVGAGLYGSIFAYEAKKRGKKVLVIDKRNHIGGNLYTKEYEGINVHYYGAHIFHTSNKKVWDYINKFATFNNYVNSPIANYKGEIYNLPFNMNTFNKLWGVITPSEAKEKIEEQRKKYYKENPINLEEQAINLVGTDIYEKLIKGYTEKQWGRDSKELPPFIIKRLPVRFTYNNNYFNDLYQGIPNGGYTKIFEKLLDGIDIRLSTDYFVNKEFFDSIATKVLYTGPLDQFYDYQYGVLDYRSLRFEHEKINTENYQGNAVVNYTDKETPYTRIIEHKHFEFTESKTTIITKEYSVDFEKGMEPYYPINDQQNQEKYQKYFELAKEESKYLFGGRLAEYKYYDMHIIIEKVLERIEQEFER